MIKRGPSKRATDYDRGMTTRKRASADSPPSPARRPDRQDCPIANTLQVVGERWALLAVREIEYGVHRFEQIVANTGASRDTLATRLRKLEEADVVTRRQYCEHPPRYEYYLTDAGHDLRPVLVSLAQWGLQWAGQGGRPTAVMRHSCGHELRVDQRCESCGEAVIAGSYAITAPPPHEGV